MSCERLSQGQELGNWKSGQGISGSRECSDWRLAFSSPALEQQALLASLTGKQYIKPMKCRISLVGIALSLALLGCSASVPPRETGQTPLKSEEHLPEPPTFASSPQNTGQMLPIAAQAEIGGERILLEVTRTPRQQQLGLMYRPELPPDRGMLFSFDPPRPVGFWMKNVKIHLDMIFLSDGEVQAIAADVPPCTAEPCPTYGPAVPIDRVIELRGGRAAELGLEVGDRVDIEFLEETTPASGAES